MRASLPLGLALAACGARAPEAPPPLESSFLVRVDPAQPVDLDALSPAPSPAPCATGLEELAGGRFALRLRLAGASARDLLLHDLHHRDGGGPCFAVHGVRDGGEVPELGVVRVAADGAWLAVPVIEDPMHRVVLARREGAEFVETARTSERWQYVDWPALDEPAARVAFWAVDGSPPGGSSVVVAEPRGAELRVTGRQGSGLVKHWPTFARNGRLAYRAVASAEPLRERVAVDGKAQRDYRFVGTPRFSERGDHLAYSARRDGRAYVVVDGEESGPFDEVGDPRFLDERRVGWVARDGSAASWVVLRLPR